MGGKKKSQSAEPPDWWNTSLYAFVETMPLDGWIWEFRRRATLKELLPPEEPVDAMNPSPRLYKGVPASLYKPWNDETSEVMTVKLPPAVVVKGAEMPRARYELTGGRAAPRPPGPWENYYTPRYPVELIVDLLRPDTVIRSDFESVLEKLREKYESPGTVAPKKERWKDNHVLEAWDLRQFEVSWKQIKEILGLNTPQSPRNAVNTASRFIEKKEWLKLALGYEIKGSVVT